MKELDIFDKTMNTINDDYLIVAQFVKGIFITFGSIFMLIPSIERITLMASWSLLIFATIYHLKSILYVTRNGKQTSYYRVLKHTPLPKKAYIKDRYRKFSIFLLKLGILCAILKTIGLLIANETDITVILISIGWFILIFASLALMGILDIRISTRL